MSFEWCVEFILPNHVVSENCDFKATNVEKLEKDFNLELDDDHHSLDSLKYLQTWYDICNYKKDLKDKQRSMEDE